MLLWFHLWLNEVIDTVNMHFGVAQNGFEREKIRAFYCYEKLNDIIKMRESILI